MQEDFSDKALGKTGEDLAALHLKDRGFRILERNYRCRLGEIDLIVEKKGGKKGEKKGALFFVEVKTRRSLDAVSPRELISYTKQRHISKTAQYYLASRRRDDRPAEFAVLIVDWSRNPPACEFIENAFPLAWGY